MRGKNIFRQMGEDIRGFGFKQWFLLGLNVVLALASLACLLGLRTVSHTLNSTTAADRFRGESEMRFAQVACYMPVGQGKQETDIFAFREKLEAAMVEQSLEAPENGSLYVDAYCGSAEVTVASEHGSGTVTALGVGGDFFYFHPLDLRGGTYISGDDLMDDLVVLDEAMAWRLFGSTDLAGMDMTINGQPFVVAGVIARETDFATKKAYTADGGIFMSYAALNDLLAGESGGEAQDQEEEQPAPQVQSALSIDCYEIVLPDPISGYAMNVVKENFQVGEGDVVENSGPQLRRAVHADQRRHLSLLGERSAADGGLRRTAAAPGHSPGPVPPDRDPGHGGEGHPPELSRRQGGDPRQGGGRRGEAAGGEV